MEWKRNVKNKCDHKEKIETTQYEYPELYKNESVGKYDQSVYIKCL